MASFKVNLLDLEQGATYHKQFTWKAGDPLAPVDFGTATARADFRDAVDATDVCFNLNTEDGSIVLGTGTIDITILPSLTDGKEWRKGVYNIEIVTSDDEIRRLVEGKWKLSPDATHE